MKDANNLRIFWNNSTWKLFDSYLYQDAFSGFNTRTDVKEFLNDLFIID